jgi:hypothetical protein
MAEAGASTEEVLHDDLCPVRQLLLLFVIPSSWYLDLPAVALHTCENIMQPSPVCILHGTVGRCIFDKPN